MVYELSRIIGEDVPGVKTGLKVSDHLKDLAAAKVEDDSAEADEAGAATLQQTKEIIAAALGSRTRPLVVFVDEVDRLSHDEIRTP